MLYIIILILIAVFIYFLFNRKKNKVITSLDKRTGADISKATRKDTTPGGVVYYASKQLSPAQEQSIDEAFRKVLADARLDGYTNMLDPRFYTVIVIKGDREFDSDGNYVPNFKLYTDSYAGTIYNHNDGDGNYIYAAEEVIYGSDSFIICEYNRDFDTTAQAAVRNGLEHLILKHNDIKKYAETLVHSTGGHPLIVERTS